MAIHARDIRFSFNTRFALSVDAFTGSAGECVGVIGANGSGKTTLLRIIAGLLPVERGELLLDGRPLGEYSANRRARHLAYVPQSHRPTFEFTVEQMVLLGRMPYRSAYGGFETEEDIAAAERALELLELQALRSAPVTRLSGGELQRVMIAKALAQQSGTIILDEPNSHLDIGHQLRILEIVRRHAHEAGICVIASIHDLNLASIFSDRIVMIDGGRVIGEGTPGELLREELLSAAFGANLMVEPGAFGSVPAVRYRHHRGATNDG